MKALVCRGSHEWPDCRVVEKAGFSFGPTILSEASRAGLEPALALALVEQESGFRNIFGCDLGPRDSAPWCHQEVTRDRVKALINHVNKGGVSNGVGLTQLTSIGFIREAEAAGGADKVDAQCRVGFQTLHGLIARHGQRVGIGAYNGGEGNPNLAYADSVIALRAKWQRKIRAIKGSEGEAASDAVVHRDLRAHHPVSLKGPDIKALQLAITARGGAALHRRRPSPTASSAPTPRVRARGWRLPSVSPTRSALRPSAGTVVQLTQQLVREPSGLVGRGQAACEGPRTDPQATLRSPARSGAKAAVKWARSKIGSTRTRMNWGHPVQDWITFTGYDGPTLWCGCFVAFAVVEKGGADVPERKRLGLDLNINDDARAGRNGFARAVPASEAKPRRHRHLQLPPHRPRRGPDQGRDDPHDRRQLLGQQRHQQQRRRGRRAPALGQPGHVCRPFALLTATQCGASHSD